MKSLDWMTFPNRNTVILYASKLAGCANMHKYVSQADLTDQLHHFFGMNPDYINPVDVAEADIKALGTECQAKLQGIMEDKYSSPEQVHGTLAHLKDEFVQKPAQAVKEVEKLLTKSHAKIVQLHNFIMEKKELLSEAEETLVKKVLDGSLRVEDIDASTTSHSCIETSRIASEVQKEVVQSRVEAADAIDQVSLAEHREILLNNLNNVVDKLDSMAARALHNCPNIDADLSDSYRTEQNKVAEIEKKVVLQENVVQTVQSKVYTSHGCEREDGIREAVKSSKNIDIQTSNKFVVSKEPFIEVRGVRVFLGGRHDGMSDDGTKIVEIKTRQNRFLGTPLYELVQVHAYMFIYGVTEATIVESYNGQERMHEVGFDEKLWERVKKRVHAFFDGGLPVC